MATADDLTPIPLDCDGCGALHVATVRNTAERRAVRSVICDYCWQNDGKRPSGLARRTSLYHGRAAKAEPREPSCLSPILSELPEELRAEIRRRMSPPRFPDEGMSVCPERPVISRLTRGATDFKPFDEIDARRLRHSVREKWAALAERNIDPASFHPIAYELDAGAWARGLEVERREREEALFGAPRSATIYGRPPYDSHRDDVRKWLKNKATIAAHLAGGAVSAPEMRAAIREVVPMPAGSLRARDCGFQPDELPARDPNDRTDALARAEKHDKMRAQMPERDESEGAQRMREIVSSQQSFRKNCGMPTGITWATRYVQKLRAHPDPEVAAAAARACSKYAGLIRAHTVPVPPQHRNGRLVERGALASAMSWLRTQMGLES